MAGMAGIYSTKGVEPESDKADDRSDEPSLRSDSAYGIHFGCHWPLRVRGTGGELDPISRDTCRQRHLRAPTWHPVYRKVSGGWPHQHHLHVR